MGRVIDFLLATGGSLPRVKQFDDPLNDTLYVADAKHGAALTDPVWRVRKMVNVAGTSDFDNITTTDNYDNLATDLATVQGLTYN